MSYTVSTNKMVAAFSSARGKTFYVLFEETYDSNLSPRTPRWSCRGIGELRDTLSRIFYAAAACEDGSLRHSSGKVLPESYIAAWLKEMANPHGIENATIDLAISEGFYATWSENSYKPHRYAMLAAGMNELVAQLDFERRASLKLYDHAELVCDLVEKYDVALWRLLSTGSMSGRLGAESKLAYAPKVASVVPKILPAVMHVDQFNCLVQQDNGSWYAAGPKWAALGSYIRMDVLQAEFSEPGGYRKAIKKMRDHIDAAPKLAIDMRVVIPKVVLDRNPYAVKRARSRFELGHTSSGDGVISVPRTVFGDAAAMYLLTALSRDEASWWVGLPAEANEPSSAVRPLPGTIYFATEPVKIGQNQWRLVVIESELYGPVTQHQFRDDPLSEWRQERLWPTWDGNLANSGMPESLGERLYEPHKSLVSKALTGVKVDLPQLGLF